MVAGLLEENRLGSVLVENRFGSALLEKMLGSCVELVKISGTAVGSGPGLCMVVDLNRSSSSLRAEYLSDAEMVCSFAGAGTLTSPALGFLFIGGRVVVGGLARGSAGRLSKAAVSKSAKLANGSAAELEKG